jgi:predicted nucleic acid-binding protein
MKYVLDASVALKWVLPEPLADKARQLRADFRIALAEREVCDFVTADDKLVKNLGVQFSFIVTLSSLS